MLISKRALRRGDVKVPRFYRLAYEDHSLRASMYLPMPANWFVHWYMKVETFVVIWFWIWVQRWRSNADAANAGYWRGYQAAQYDRDGEALSWHPRERSGT